jgi:hypothetical protein
MNVEAGFMGEILNGEGRTTRQHWMDLSAILSTIGAPVHRVEDKKLKHILSREPDGRVWQGNYPQALRHLR